jgi:hypothetical protein
MKIQSNKIVEKETEYIPLTHVTHIHDRSLSWLETNTSIKDGGVKLVLCVQLIYFYAHRRARFLYIDVIHQ